LSNADDAVSALLGTADGIWIGELEVFGFCMVVVEPGCKGVVAPGFIVDVLGLGVDAPGVGTGVCWSGAATLGFGVAGVAADGPAPADGPCAANAPATSIEPATAAAIIACLCREDITNLLAKIGIGPA
jgi:hypothetical protein